MKKGIALIIFFCTFCFATYLPAQEENYLGQVIQIQTQLHSFIGRPSWLLMIRDLDHNENIPYLFDFSRGSNFWIATTYSRNYLILASTLKISTYQSRYNTYKVYTLKNFCQLETNGRILHDESIYITLSGDLTPFANTYQCIISRYKTPFFNTAEPEELE